MKRLLDNQEQVDLVVAGLVASLEARILQQHLASEEARLWQMDKYYARDKAKGEALRILEEMGLVFAQASLTARRAVKLLDHLDERKARELDQFLQLQRLLGQKESD